MNSVLAVFLGVLFGRIECDVDLYQRTYVTGCNRGGDQADENVTKFLVTPDFPSHYKDALQCKWTVNTNHGKFVKLIPDTFDLPCLGNNGLVIEDVGMAYSGATSFKFCGGKKIPAFVSSDVKFEIHLTIDDPGPRGVRLKLGYKVVKSPVGPKVKEYSIQAFGGNPRRNQIAGYNPRTPNILNSGGSRWTGNRGVAGPVIGRPSPKWHTPLLAKGAKVAQPTKIELNYEITPAQIDEEATRKELLVIFAYVGLAVILILPTIAVLIVARNRRIKEQNEDDQSS